MVNMKAIFGDELIEFFEKIIKDKGIDIFDQMFENDEIWFISDGGVSMQIADASLMDC